MGLFRQERWSGLPFLSPRDLPIPGIKPTSTALQVDSLLLNHQRSLPGGINNRGDDPRPCSVFSGLSRETEPIGCENMNYYKKLAHSVTGSESDQDLRRVQKGEHPGRRVCDSSLSPGQT